MSLQFWPCPACSRHVKRTDAACPFCGATAALDIGPTRVLAGRLSRAALFAAGAVGVAVATTDCSSQGGSQSGSQSGSQNMAPAYGGSPVPDCGATCVTTTEIEDSGANVGSTEPAYGAVPTPVEPDASASDGPSGAAAHAGDASTVPTDSSSVSDSSSAADGSTDAGDASTAQEPTDSSSASEDAPSVIALYGGIAPPYGHVPVPDE